MQGALIAELITNTILYTTAQQAAILDAEVAIALLVNIVISEWI
jgi:hypothetical protein